MSGQKQHVQMERKTRLRRALLEDSKPGSVYVPFIGDGDISAELYTDRVIFGADLDQARVATAAERLKGSTVVTADCDGPFPFAEIAKDQTFSVGDFDAYCDPWPAFEAFWKSAQRTDPLVAFFTDGRGQGALRAGVFEGRKLDVSDRRKVFNFLPQWCRERLEKTVTPAKVLRFEFYRRSLILYYGAVIGSPENYDRDQRQRGGAAVKDDRLRKFDDEKREAFLKAVLEGSRRGSAAESVGVSYKTIEREMKRDKAFAKAVSQAEIEWASAATEKVEDALYSTAINGNVVAQQVWLYNRAADRWADKRSIDHRGIPPAQVPRDADFDPKKLSDDELRAFETLLSKGRVTKDNRGSPSPSNGDTEGGTLH